MEGQLLKTMTNNNNLHLADEILVEICNELLPDRKQMCNLLFPGGIIEFLNGFLDGFRFHGLLHCNDLT